MMNRQRIVLCHKERGGFAARFSSTVALLIGINLMLIPPTAEGRTFKYGDETTDEAYAPDSWDSVDSSDYDYDWKFLDKVYDYDGNDCDRSKQSPIDLEFDDDKCDKDDHRMISYSNGYCKWKEMDFKITPHELRMEMPITDRSDPFNKGCRKPFLDMSGGFATSFRALMVHMKTPSEHRLNGVQYDAEIQIFHIGRGGQSEELMYNGILVDASPAYPDNPVLQPYLDGWKDTHDKTQKMCYDKFGYMPELALNNPPTRSPSSQPSISKAPSVSPSVSPTNSPTVSSEPSSVPSHSPTINCEEKSLSTGFPSSTKERQGVMFDIEVQSMPSKDLAIHGFDINLDDDGQEQIQVYSKRGTHIGAESDPKQWTDLGIYTVDGQGKRDPTRVNLMEPVPLPATVGERQAFYILHVDGSDLQTHKESSSRKFDSVHTSDGTLMIHVGTAKDDDAFEDDDRPGEGFSGTVLYGECHSVDSNGWPTMSPTVSKMPTASPTPDPCTDGALSTGFMDADEDETEVQGIMFDVESKIIDEILLIEAIDLNIDDTSSHKIQVYIKEGTHAGFESNEMVWTDFGEFSVKGMGKNKPTKLVLNETIALPPAGQKLALYLVQNNDDDMQTYENENEAQSINDEHVSDQNLKIYIGTGKEGRRISSDSVDRVGFSGTLHYSICPKTSRRLDYLGKGKLTRFPYINLYRLHPSPWYFRYYGSLTSPPCSSVRHWRVFDTPMKISQAQLELVNEMLREHRDPNTCKLATQGQVDSNGRINVARPLQKKRSEHSVEYCSSKIFGSTVKSIDFYETPRANTGWENLPKDPQYAEFHERQGN